MSQIHEFVKAHDYTCWCGQSTARVACRQMHLGRRFAVLECAACRTQRVLPKALNEQSAAATLYNQCAGLDFTDFVPEQTIKSMLHRLQETQIHFEPGKKVLDVGCGSGILLETLCEQFHCVGWGIDVDQRRIDK